MSATTALQRGRIKAASLMLDTVTVTRLVPDPTGASTDGETGVVTPSYTTVYTGPCKVQETQSEVARPEEVGQAERFVGRLELHLPVTVVGVASDDIATITATVLDPDLVGRVFHVRELAHKTFATARRYGIVEVTS